MNGLESPKNYYTSIQHKRLKTGNMNEYLFNG